MTLKMNLKILLGLLLVIFCGKAVEMNFKADFDHKFVFTNRDDILQSGFQPDIPELQNNCDPWVGFYAEFSVDYTKFNQSAALSVGGGGVKVCFTNTSELKETHRKVFVTDLLKQTKLWPSSVSGPLNPSVTNVSLYSSPNGFTTEFKQGANANTWCLESGSFGKFMDAFSGKANYIFGLSLSLPDYEKDCKTGTDVYIAKFSTNGGTL